MEMKKFVGGGLLAVIALAFAIAIIAPYNEDSWYELVGLGFMVFGIWGGILLIKEDKK